MNETERARRISLQLRGIGPSVLAVRTRRTREIMARIHQIDRGERLPGWTSVPNLATPEKVDEFLFQLNPDARAKTVNSNRKP